MSALLPTGNTPVGRYVDTFCISFVADFISRPCAAAAPSASTLAYHNSHPRVTDVHVRRLLAEWLAPISGAAASTRSGPQVVNALAAHGAGDEAFATRPGMAAALQADGYFCFPRLP